MFVQFHDAPDEGQRRQLRQMGVILHRPATGGAWYATVPAAALERLMALPMVRAVSAVEGRDKMPRGLREKGPPFWARNPDGSAGVTVQFYPDVPFDEARRVLKKYGAVGGKKYLFNRKLSTDADPKRLQALAGEDAVSWVDAAAPPPEEHNETAAVRSRVNIIHAAPYGLSGQGVRTSIWDGGEVYASHGDFGGRVTVVEHPGVSSHATHVAGTIMGSGAGDTRAKGMAPAATLYSYYFYGDVPGEQYDAAGAYGLSAANHSWGFVTGWRWNGSSWVWYGDSNFGNYTSYTMDWDELVRLTSLVVVKSAGNDRNDWGDGSHPQDGPYDCVGQIASAKNIITVGALNDDDTMSVFSSWGPTDDGRIKPDVVANGVTLRSTLPGGYGSYSGTSMSSPVVTGICALLVERYRSTHDGTAPSAAAVKALLIHTARDLGNPGPDYSYGYGIVDAKAAVDVVDADVASARGVIRTEGAGNGQVIEYEVFVPEEELELKLTVVWTDVPGLPSSTARDLVNDLDLALISPGGTVHYPWALSRDHPSQPAFHGTNSVDNVEQVLVADPAAGSWTVRVTGSAVPAGPQEFTLVSSLPFGMPVSVEAFLSGPSSLEEGSSGLFDASGSAASSGTLTYEWDWDYDGVTFEPSGDTGPTAVHGWPDETAVTVAVRASALGQTDIAALEVDVLNVDPVILGSPPVTATEEVPYEYMVEADDPGTQDVLAYSLDVSPAGMSMDAGSGFIVWLPGNAQAARSHEILIRVTDGDGGEGTRAFTIMVENTNDAPVIRSSPVTAAVVGELYEYQVGAWDDDLLNPSGELLAYHLDEAPAGMTIEGASGLIGWVPAPGDGGWHHPITVGVTDAAGETAVQSYELWVDSVNHQPVADPGPDLSVECSGQGRAEVLLDGSGSSDPDDDPLSYLWWWLPDGAATGERPFVSLPLGATAVNLAVSDGALESEPSAALIIVVDTGAPVISLEGPASTDLECGARYVEAGASAADACEGDISGRVQAGGAVDPGTAGTYVLSYNVTDSAGNAAEEAVRTVTVHDTVSPAITCPAGVVVATAAGQCSAAVSLSAQAEDACDPYVAVTSDAPDTFPAGATVVTFSARDSAGNTSSCSTMVTVVDREPPVITLKAGSSAEVECRGIYEDPGVSATDNCDGDLSGSVTVSGSVDLTAPGDYQLSYAVADGSGNNAAGVKRTVAVRDTTAPVITLTVDDDQVVGCAGQQYSTGAELSEACDSTAAIVMVDNVDLSAPGDYTVTYDATDASGNAAVTVIQHVAVVEAGSPLLEITYPDAAACLNDESVTIRYEALGTCGSEVAVSFSPGNGTYTEEGEYFVTVTAADPAGNMVYRQVSFTIDRSVPEIAISSPLEEPHPDSIFPATNYCLGTDEPPAVVFSVDEDDEEPLGGIIHEVVLVDGAVIFDGDEFGNQDGLLSDELYDDEGNEMLVLDSDLLCEAGLDVLGMHILTVEAKDCSGNTGSAEVEFEVVLCLDEGDVVVKPESLKSNGGVMTVFAWLPEISDCDSSYMPEDIDAADVALAALSNGTIVPAEKVNRAGDKLIIKFRRDEFPESIGRDFMLSGTLGGEGGPVFVGFDSVKKNP